MADERIEYENLRKDHMDRLGENAELVVIEGSTHADIYFHRDYRKLISQKIDEFLGRTE